jgi:hypothetical protein
MSANVTKYEVSKVQIPSIFESEDRGLDRLASPQLVLASLSSNSRYKNDITKIAVVCDVLTVELERSNGTIIAAPGLVVNFPHQANAKGFVIDWRQLETTLPSGAIVIDTDCYKIKISFEIAGTEGSYYYGAYRLKTWSIEVARNTVQVFSILNDVVRDDGINYRDSGFGGTIRFEGSFGYMQPNFDTKNLTYSDRSRKKVRNEALRTYELRTSYVTNCITEELDNDHLLAANQIWVTEHNPVAHKQYRQFPVILSEEESPSMEYTLGQKAKLIATFKDKVATHESKYDGSIEAKLNISFDLPQGTQVEGCLPGTVNVNQSDSSLIAAVNVASGGLEDYNVADSVITLNTNEVSVNVLATDNKNFNLLNQNGETLTVNNVVGNDVTLNSWWQRNPLWPDLPVINVGDERFVGLYAVFEDDVDDNTITIDVGSGQSIDYGDGTSITSSAGTNTHTYTYATVTGAVVQTPQGSNYKMVIVDVDLTGVTDMLLDQAVGAHSFRSTGWLDISAASSTLNRIDLAGDAVPFLLERFVVEEMNLNSNDIARAVRGCNMLKIYDYPLLNSTNIANGLFEDAAQGGIRDKNNNPIEINNPTGGDFRVFCRFSGVDKLGDINLPNAWVDFMFQFSNISEIGNMYFDGVGNTNRMFLNSRIRKVGTIQVSSALTSIFRMFFFVTLEEIIFTGDMSGVTNTGGAFDINSALKRLLMPLMSVGFDISDSSISGTPLQDLFTSLGNANGAQTITLPNFTIGQSTTIATNKGYTIAYA